MGLLKVEPNFPLSQEAVEDLTDEIIVSCPQGSPGGIDKWWIFYGHSLEKKKKWWLGVF